MKAQRTTYASRAIYTPAERAERRRACKAASDRRCRERKNANAQKYRAARIAKGLTGHGKPRHVRTINPKTAALRPFMTDLVRTDTQVAYSQPAEDTDAAIARGVPYFLLPPPTFAPASVNRVGPRYGGAA